MFLFLFGSLIILQQQFLPGFLPDVPDPVRDGIIIAGGGFIAWMLSKYIPAYMSRLADARFDERKSELQIQIEEKHTDNVLKEESERARNVMIMSQSATLESLAKAVISILSSTEANRVANAANAAAITSVTEIANETKATIDQIVESLEEISKDLQAVMSKIDNVNRQMIVPEIKITVPDGSATPPVTENKV